MGVLSLFLYCSLGFHLFCNADNVSADDDTCLLQVNKVEHSDSQPGTNPLQKLLTPLLRPFDGMSSFFSDALGVMPDSLFVTGRMPNLNNLKTFDDNPHHINFLKQ